MSIYRRFAFATSLNFVISYGCYWLLLRLIRPSWAYLVAYVLGIAVGNILHVRYTHQKRLTAANLITQTTILLVIGMFAAVANGALSAHIDPRLAGLLMIVVCAGLSFTCSRLLLR